MSSLSKEDLESFQKKNSNERDSQLGYITRFASKYYCKQDCGTTTFTIKPACVH